jgi:hypothetical protein
MLTNLGLAQFVDRLSRDEALQQEVARDFEGALSREGLTLNNQDRDALRAAWHFIREYSPLARNERIIAGWGIGC